MRNLSMVVLGAALCACGPAQRQNPGGDDDGTDASVNGDADTTVPGDGSVQTFVYAHTSSQLYKVDPDTLTVMLVGNFSFAGGGADQITDIAIDKTGLMIGISFQSVYRIDPTTAACTRLSQDLTATFNGLSFVPASEIGQTGPDILVATRNTSGVVSRIDPATGAVTQVGNMGSFSSSGDLVSIVGLGTMQTADNGSAPTGSCGSRRTRSPRPRSGPTSATWTSGASRTGRTRSSGSPRPGSSSRSIRRPGRGHSCRATDRTGGARP